MQLHQLVILYMLQLVLIQVCLLYTSSEADFQFALAWEIKSEIPEAEVRLEYCPVDIDSSMHIDILVKIGQDIYPIELKYMTKQCDVAVDAERFIFKNQGARCV